MDICYLLDPLIATGGTVCAALQMLLDWGLSSECIAHVCKFFLTFSSVKNIRLLAVLVSEDGLKKVTAEFPDLEVGVSMSL